MATQTHAAEQQKSPREKPESKLFQPNPIDNYKGPGIARSWYIEEEQEIAEQQGQQKPPFHAEQEKPTGQGQKKNSRPARTKSLELRLEPEQEKKEAAESKQRSLSLDYLYWPNWDGYGPARHGRNSDTPNSGNNSQKNDRERTSYAALLAHARKTCAKALSANSREQKNEQQESSSEDSSGEETV